MCADNDLEERDGCINLWSLVPHGDGEEKAVDEAHHRTTGVQWWEDMRALASQEGRAAVIWERNPRTPKSRRLRRYKVLPDGTLKLIESKEAEDE